MCKLSRERCVDSNNVIHKAFNIAAYGARNANDNRAWEPERTGKRRMRVSRLPHRQVWELGLWNESPAPSVGISHPARNIESRLKLVIDPGGEAVWRPGNLHPGLDAGAFETLTLPCQVFSFRHDEHIA